MSFSTEELRSWYLCGVRDSECSAFSGGWVRRLSSLAARIHDTPGQWASGCRDMDVLFEGHWFTSSPLPPTTSTTMSQSVSSKNLQAILEHVFMPLRLPQKDAGDDANNEQDVVLCDLILSAAQKYTSFLDEEQQLLWIPVIEMLRHLQKFTTFRDKEKVIAALASMGCGGTSLWRLFCATQILMKR